MIVDKNAYNPDESISLTCKIDNLECEKDVKVVEALLVRKITALEQGGKPYKFEKIIAKETLKGVDAQSLMTLRVDISLEDASTKKMKNYQKYA